VLKTREDVPPLHLLADVLCIQ